VNATRILFLEKILKSGARIGHAAGAG